jgi:hypothetical protein
MANPCPKCKEPSQPGKRLCADCGAEIDPPASSGQIRSLISEELQARFKDRHFVDLETSIAIADRLKGWAKLFAFCAGIPLLLLLLGLAVWGIRTYDDFVAKVNAAEHQVDTRTRAAIDQIKLAEDYARSTIDRSKAVQKDLDDARQVVAQVRRLRSDVDSLQSEVEGFYKTQMRELFGGHEKETSYSGAPGKWVVVLSKQPIPASLRVRCGAMELYPENYQLAGSKLTVRCDLDLKPLLDSKNPYSEQSFIEVLYHTRN